MKVGIVVPFSWSFRGGVPDHADKQARSLMDLGVDARVVIGHDPPGRLTKLLHPRMGVHEPPPPFVLPIGRSVIVPAVGSLSNIVLSPTAMTRMRRLWREEEFDVVHVHEPLAPLISAFALASAPCPIVATTHSSGGRWNGLGRACWGGLADRIDHRLAVSEVARAASARTIGGDAEVLPNGVSLPEDYEADDRLDQVVFIGRHEPRKGLEVLLRAWPRIAEATGARLRVIGADPLSVRLLLRRSGAPRDSIDVLGIMSVEDRDAEIAAAKVLVAPSLAGESFGMVLTEAFACATPVIASDIPGYNEVAGEETGLLVRPGDADALADAVVALLSDERRRAALGLRARRIAEERYSWPAIAGRLIQIYESLSGVRGPGVDVVTA